MMVGVLGVGGSGPRSLLEFDYPLGDYINKTTHYSDNTGRG